MADFVGDILVGPDYFMAVADDYAGDILVGPAYFMATPETGIPTVEYHQRLYDAGTAGWVYYVKTVIDPTPASGETTPNYTGAISVHSIVDSFIT